MVTSEQTLNKINFSDYVYVTLFLCKKTVLSTYSCTEIDEDMFVDVDKRLDNEDSAENLLVCTVCSGSTDSICRNTGTYLCVCTVSKYVCMYTYIHAYTCTWMISTIMYMPMCIFSYTHMHVHGMLCILLYTCSVQYVKQLLISKLIFYNTVLVMLLCFILLWTWLFWTRYTQVT